MQLNKFLRFLKKLLHSQFFLNMFHIAFTYTHLSSTKHTYKLGQGMNVGIDGCGEIDDVVVNLESQLQD